MADMKFQHEPVLLAETIEALNIKENGIYVDCTVGGAGHSIEILKRVGKDGRLVAIDQDANALMAATERLKEYKDQVYFIKCNYAYLGQILDELNIDKVDGVLMDIGVSSHQLDEGNRGFSYHQDAPLDMRMDSDQELTAKDVVNTYSQEELETILWNYGEEKWGMRIAEFIVKAREEKEIETTFELVDIIKAAIPKKVRMNSKHPAKKTFQAIRIEVNKELDVLETGIHSAVDRLKVGGRLVIITFHSLEDRIVKTNFKELAQTFEYPPEIPIQAHEKTEKIKVITRKPIVASKEELEKNNRSRSAKLRVAERV